MTAKLHLLPEAPDSEVFELIEPMVLIGRRPDNTLQIEDDNVSKYHALLVKTEDGYRLFDLHSVNGTFVNDQRITTVLLKNNDQLRIGPALFRFESAPETVAAPAPVPQPKIRFGGRLAAGPLGRKPGVAPTTVSPPGSAPVVAPPSPQPAPVPVAVPAAPPEPQKPTAAVAVPATPRPSQAVPVAPIAAPSTPPAAPSPEEDEPRVSIRIPEEKKSLIAPTISDSKETQPTAPAGGPSAAPKPRLGLGLRRAPEAAPSPPSSPETAPAGEPAPTPPEAGKASGTERPLRPALGGLGQRPIKLKTFKK